MKTLTYTLSLPLILFATLAACAPTDGDELGMETEEATSSALAVTPQLQLSLSRLAITYGTALDAIGGRLIDVFPDHDVTAIEFENYVWLVYPSRTHLPLKVRAFVELLERELEDTAV